MDIQGADDGATTASSFAPQATRNPAQEGFHGTDSAEFQEPFGQKTRCQSRAPHPPDCCDGTDSAEFQEPFGQKTRCQSRAPHPSDCCDTAAVLHRRLREAEGEIAELKQVVKDRDRRIEALEEQVSARTRVDSSDESRHCMSRASVPWQTAQDEVSALQDKIWVLEEKLASKEAEVLAQGADLLQERAECKALGESLTTMQDIMKRRVSALERELTIKAERLAKDNPLEISACPEVVETEDGSIHEGLEVQEGRKGRKEGRVEACEVPDGKRIESENGIRPQASPPLEESEGALVQVLRKHRSKGDVQSILDQMVVHHARDAFQVEACRALSTLADHQSFDTACKASIQRILAAMERHAGNSCLQAAGCSAIAHISRVHDDARCSTASAGGIFTIIGAVDTHRTAEVLEPAMGALLALCSGHAGLQQRIKDELGPERAAYAIKHISSPLKEQLQNIFLASSI